MEGKPNGPGLELTEKELLNYLALLHCIPFLCFCHHSAKEVKSKEIICLVKLKSSAIYSSVWIQGERIWGKEPEGNSLVSVEAGQTFDFALPTRQYNCLKGYQSTLRKDTWMLGTTNDKYPLNSLPLPLLLIYSAILGLSLLLTQSKPSGVVLTLGIEEAKN